MTASRQTNLVVNHVVDKEVNPQVAKTRPLVAIASAQAWHRPFTTGIAILTYFSLSLSLSVFSAPWRLQQRK
ncbi:hypothetical protein LX36DRAFT_657921 [Colletotrichum falcatum]|nr:hypothetical protein LX36DRAFT_657921 [Colletotrichum falcatum]